MLQLSACAMQGGGVTSCFAHYLLILRSSELCLSCCPTCRYRHAATATTAEVLQSYSESATTSQGVPGPQPLYQESLDVAPPASATGVTAVDFQLLRLSAGDLPGADVQQGLAELLRPSGTPSLFACSTIRETSAGVCCPG